ncbi:MAG: hypothetical protein AB7U47_17420, partial [Variibacter sp.]
MPNMPRSALWACSFGAALVLGALGPASAAPAAPLAGVSAAASGAATIQVAARKKPRHKYRHGHRRSHGGGRVYAPRGYDNVGSVGQDGY